MENNLASLLRDFAQGASNSVAGNVAVPVDAIAWLLRKGGVNVPPNPVMGSDWLAEKGFTREPQNKLAGLVGDLAGFAAPLGVAAKAPQIAKGLLATQEGALTAGKYLGKEAIRPVNDAILYGTGPLKKVLPQTPHIFIGQNAKNFDKTALDKALELEKSGADMRSIWGETGTFKHPADSKWRQEIDDSTANVLNFGKNKEGKMFEVLDHPSLYDAYPSQQYTHAKITSETTLPPHLRKVLEKQSSGSYSHGGVDGEHLIEASAYSPDALKSTLSHELQHAIQSREGFASGGSPDAFKQSIPKNLKDVAFNRNMQEAIISRKLADNGVDIKRGEFLDFGKPKNMQLMQDMIVKNPELKTDFDNLNTLNQKLGKYALSPQAKYERLAGEAEARAVQARMNMDASQRRATYPLDSYDVPVDQLITRYGDAPAMSQGNERLLKILERNGESVAPKPAITYHASPVKLDLKDRYGKGYDELYDKVNNFDGSTDEFLKWENFLKKYEGGSLGNNAGKKADQLYVSNQPDAWKSVQTDELNVPYDLGGIYGLEVNKAPNYYMQKSGMGQQLPEAVISAKDVINQHGPFKTKAELDKYLYSIGKL